MNKIFSNLLKSILVIASLSQTVHASVIASDNDFTFTWSAVCGDCNSTKGEFDNTQNVEVSGSIVLKDYTPGEAFIINDENLVSFSYDGPSIHIDAFTLKNDNDNASRFNTFEAGIFNVSGSIAADQSSFSLDLSHIIWEANGVTYTEMPDHVYAYPSVMDVHFGLGANWAFNLEGIPWDFGVNAAIAPASNTVTDVPEPTTLAIFAFGLVGLAARKFKHNA